MVRLSLIKNSQLRFGEGNLFILLLILAVGIGLGSCDTNNSGDSGPKGKANIRIRGAINDVFSFSPTFTVLEDSSNQVPGPLTFQTNIRITGGKAAKDSVKMTLYILDKASSLTPKAFLVKKLTLETNPDKAVAAILETSGGSIYETQTTSRAEGTLVINSYEDKRIKGELKALKLGDGTQTIVLNGTFQAVKP